MERPAISLTMWHMYVYLWNYVKVHGYPPSYREIGEGCGLKSMSTVAWRLRRLEDKGYIEQGGAHAPRAIRLLVNLEP